MVSFMHTYAFSTYVRVAVPGGAVWNAHAFCAFPSPLRRIETRTHLGIQSYGAAPVASSCDYTLAECRDILSNYLLYVCVYIGLTVSVCQVHTCFAYDLIVDHYMPKTGIGNKG